MPAVTTNNLTINKTPPHGMNHAPPGNPVFVPEGGTITICNRRRRRVKLRVIVDGEETYATWIAAGDCITLTVGTAEVPNASYEVIDPPALLRLVGHTGATFHFQPLRKHKRRK